ncbi:hypothetical protein GCM10022409_08190 [Hymenobacter glaciei]|uniref:Glutamine cyclotransferase n=1 Tax=Hymenobacter glaciei TaxID=877209 RepID=A0ABP7TI21_9BACT
MLHSPKKSLLGLAVSLLLLSGCDQQKPTAEQAKPVVAPVVPPQEVVAEAVVTEPKVLTSADTWPSTSHDTLRFQSGVVYLSPSTAAVFQKLPASGLVNRADLRNTPNGVKSAEGVSQQGTGLWLKPSNGRAVVLATDTSDSESNVDYHYWGTLPAVRQWVVSVTLYEGSEVELVDQRTGRRTSLWGQPIPSPDGRYILAYSIDMEAQYDPNGLQLYKVEATGLRLLWERTLKQWGPVEVRWDGNSAILIKQESGAGSPPNGYVRLDLSKVQ